MTKERKWQLTLTESQLRLIAQCVEDCSRFASGQTEMGYMVNSLEDSSSVREELKALKPIVTPHLEWNASYGWNGGGCSHKFQREFIARTYYLYREIIHCITKERNKTEDLSWCVYLGRILRCKESGEPIKLEVVDEIIQTD